MYLFIEVSCESMSCTRVIIICCLPTFCIRKTNKIFHFKLSVIWLKIEVELMLFKIYIPT